MGPLASSLAGYRLCIKYTTNRVFYTRGVTFAVACPGGGLVKMIDPAILFVGTRHLNFPETLLNTCLELVWARWPTPWCAIVCVENVQQTEYFIHAA